MNRIKVFRSKPLNCIRTSMLVATINSLILFASPSLAAPRTESPATSPDSARLTSPSWFPHVTSSDELDGAITAHGHVQRTDTKALDPTEVTLLAWPSANTLGNMDVGDAASLTPIAKDLVDKSGAFELRIDPSLVDFATAGPRDFEIVATTGELVGVTGFTGELTKTGPGEYAIKHSYPNVKHEFEIELRQGNVVDTPKSPAASDYRTAGVDLVQDYGPRWVAVGATYITKLRHQERFRLL